MYMAQICQSLPVFDIPIVCIKIKFQTKSNRFESVKENSSNRLAESLLFVY